MPASERSLQITESYRERIVATRNRVEAAAAEHWPTIETLDKTTWPRRMAAVVSQAQAEVVRASGGYLTAYLSSELGQRTTGPVVASKGYAGKSRDGRPLAEAYQSPLVGVLAALKDGVVPDVALKEGLVRAKRMVEMDLMNAARVAQQDAMKKDGRFTGWRRATTGTCGACAGDAGDAALAPGTPLEVHPYCECVAEGVVAVSPEQALADRAINVGKFHQTGDFTPDDWEAVFGHGGYGYFGSPYAFTINEFARTGSLGANDFDLSQDFVKQIISGLDTAIEHAGPVGQPVRAFRGIKATPEAIGIKPGQTFTDAAFGSTSANPELTMEAETVLDLTVDPKVKALWGGNKVEEELLLQRGCRFLVESIEREGGKWHVKANVLPPE